MRWIFAPAVGDPTQAGRGVVCRNSRIAAGPVRHCGSLRGKETLDRIVKQLEVLGLDRVKELLPWMLQNAEGQELTREFGQKRNTITTRFYRGMRKAADAAGITWE